MALWGERGWLEQSVIEGERDRSKHDGEDTAVLVRWRIHSDPRCSSTTLGQKRHLAQTSPTATAFSGLQTGGQPTKQRIGASRSVVAGVAYRGVKMDKCNRVWRFGADMSAREE
jgi:hypothetical protein